MLQHVDLCEDELTKLFQGGGRMSSNRREIDRLTNELLEDLLITTDEEVIAEATEDGIDVDRAVSKVRSLIEKNRFKIAQKDIKSKKAPGSGLYSRKRGAIDINEARKRIINALNENPSYADNYTMAARSGENLPDEDVMGWYEDMIELGLIKDGQNSDDK